MDDQSSSHDGPKARVVPPEAIELIDPAYEPTWAEQPTATLPPSPIRFRKRLPLLLFIATCLSTAWAGAVKASVDLDPAARLWEGILYGAAVMAILIAHEMGHYLQALRYGVPATPPFFIPMPFIPFGTFGAVILQGRGIGDRKAIFDIAISGPLAGLIVAIPITFIGLSQSEMTFEPSQPGELVFGAPLIVQWMVELTHGGFSPGARLLETPLAFAGWVGIFITALNLIPIGQLDGGHILYTLIGKRAHRVAAGLVLFALAYMFLSGNPSYAVMLMLIVFMGIRHPPTADDTVPLGRGRIILGWSTLAFIVIGFTPSPVSSIRERPPMQQPEAAVLFEVENDANKSAERVTVQPSQRDFMNARAFSAR
jgi:membrane-associated protease RseP (regulator of RpoE activity)